MGTSNFNLRQSVDNYVRLIRNQGSITGSDAAELTVHLYDATDELKKSGLSEEEAFNIACKRLGNEELLTEEYSKVNTSVRTNKIWAYLLIGYNLFYKVPALIFLGIGFFYIQIYQHFSSSGLGVLIITLFHLVFVAGIYYLVRQKNKISHFIERQVQVNPVRIVCLSFIPFVFLLLAQPVFGIPMAKLTAALADYPLRTFHSGLIEFSFDVAAFSIVGGILSLVFSIKVPEKLSLRHLFEKPSVLFLILFGAFIELMAFPTRAIRFPFDTELIRSGGRLMWTEGYFNKMVSAALFGIVYLIGSFLITYYNKLNAVNRYLLIFSSFGFIMETTAGIDADLSRGNTYYTVYYVSAMLIGIFLGKILGSKTSNEGLMAETN